jgi:hypothetical protein
MKTDDRSSDPAKSREEEAHDPRPGRPMPEEDAASRTEHHKGSYGGEHGKPREDDRPKTGDDKGK